MIVVAIIGILAAIAIPAYQDYTVRAQVTEGLNLAAEVKTAVSEFHSARGGFPGSNASAGVSSSGSITGNYVTNVSVESDGAVTITYGNRVNTNAATKTVRLHACENAAKGVVWVCGTASAPAGVSNCTDSLAAGSGVAAGTDMPGKYMPADCRS